MTQANDGKNLTITVDGTTYQRIPVKTKLVMPQDNLEEVVTQALATKVSPQDVVFVTEKIVAITQGRSYKIEEIHPRKIAVKLSSYVQKTPAGIGLGMPETMEMALRECGTIRILLAAAIGGFTKKVLGRRGDFYRIAGPNARAIDGPTSGTIEPYNKAVVIGPKNPGQVATRLASILSAQAGGQVDVLISDINDLGGNILGSSLPRTLNKTWVEVLKDNPLGQGHEGTPIGIIRRETH